MQTTTPKRWTASPVAKEASGGRGVDDHSSVLNPRHKNHTAALPDGVAITHSGAVGPAPSPNKMERRKCLAGALGRFPRTISKMPKWDSHPHDWSITLKGF